MTVSKYAIADAAIRERRAHAAFLRAPACDRFAELRLHREAADELTRLVEAYDDQAERAPCVEPRV